MTDLIAKLVEMVLDNKKRSTVIILVIAIVALSPFAILQTIPNIKVNSPTNTAIQNVSSLSGNNVNINGDNNQVNIPPAPESPGLHFSGDTFKESKPAIYGSYSYIKTGDNGQINVTSQSDTFYGSTHTIMEAGNSSTINWATTNDQVGK